MPRGIDLWKFRAVLKSLRTQMSASKFLYTQKAPSASKLRSSTSSYEARFRGSVEKPSLTGMTKLKHSRGKISGVVFRLIFSDLNISIYGLLWRLKKDIYPKRHGELIGEVLMIKISRRIDKIRTISIWAIRNYDTRFLYKMLRNRIQKSGSNIGIPRLNYF